MPTQTLPAAAVLIVLAFALPAAADHAPIPPMPPTDLRAAHDGATGAVTLAWTPAPGDVEAYAVYRNGEPLGTTGGDSHGFTDAAPAAAGSYVVTARAAGGESPPSNPAVVTLLPATPEAGDAVEAGAAEAPVKAIVAGREMCEPLILSGIPPSWHINWDCIDLPPSMEG